MVRPDSTTKDTQLEARLQTKFAVGQAAEHYQRRSIPRYMSKDGSLTS